MKKRMVIAIEDQMLGNHYIAPGAMKFDPDAEYEVKWGSGDKVIGKARSLQREGNKITAEIELDQLMFINLDDTAGMCFAREVNYNPEKSEDRAFHIDHALVQNVSLYDAAGYFSVPKLNKEDG